MEKSLKQDEIDALFLAARTRTVAPPAEARTRVQPYSFARAGQISNDQMRAISLLNDLFARNLTHNLGAWLRAQCQVSLVSAEQIPFNEFVMRIPELAYVCSVRLEPLRAMSVLQLELAPVPSMIDLLLGGEGATSTVRELTDIEESILSGVVEIICRELSSAWQPVGLSFQFDRRQMQTQIGRLLPVTERALCLSFELRLPQASGLLNLAFPAVVSNTVLRRLTSDWTRQRRHSAETRDRMRQRVSEVLTHATLQLPPVRLRVSELEALHPGKVLGFPLGSASASELRVAGVPVFHAAPVGRGTRRCAHLLSHISEGAQ